MISKFSKQFFWLFAIVGFFLSLILLANDYFSHQIFLEEYERQMAFCIESNKQCNLEKIASKEQVNLNANQLKLIELNTLIINFKNYLRNILIIFGVFNLIAVIPMLVNVYSDILSRIKQSR
jgi:uncharacterized membrane protein|tara:strand:- start:170 stop:535 length:366 start_codon:yes stop_codon:yes gene_type:complete